MSTVRRIAHHVRLIAQDGADTARELEADLSALGLVSERARQMRADGVDTGALVRALEDARHKTRVASEALRTLQASGRRYSAWLALPGGSSGTGAGAALPSDPGSDHLAAVLEARGFALTDVDTLDYSDNPIPPDDWAISPGGGATREDIAWAVARWDDTVASGIRSGMTRDDFERMDSANGAMGYRRLGGVWDTFLGDDGIWSGGAASSGIGHDVGGGRHRIEVARALGVRWLPVRFRSATH